MLHATRYMLCAASYKLYASTPLHHYISFLSIWSQIYLMVRKGTTPLHGLYLEPERLCWLIWAPLHHYMSFWSIWSQIDLMVREGTTPLHGFFARISRAWTPLLVVLSSTTPLHEFLKHMVSDRPDGQRSHYTTTWLFCTYISSLNASAGWFELHYTTTWVFEAYDGR